MKLSLYVSLALLCAPLSGAYAGDDHDNDHDGHGMQRSPQCCTPANKNFPMVNANYGNTMYSNLPQINKHTIGRLGGAWMLHVDGGITL